MQPSQQNRDQSVLKHDRVKCFVFGLLFLRNFVVGAALVEE